MPWLAALLGSLVSSFTAWIVLALPGLVYRALTALGVTAVIYVGIDFVITEAQNYIFATMSAIPIAVFEIIKMAGFHQGFTMLFSAWTAQLSIKTTMGVYDRWTARPSNLIA